MKKIILKSVFLISLVSAQIQALGQQYQLMKSSTSTSSALQGNSQLLISYTIGQTSLINGIHTGGTQILQGFEYQLLSKRIEPEASNKLYAFPNPTFGLVSIKRENDDPENIHLIIYDLKGAVLKSFDQYISGKYVKIDLSSFPKGYYQISMKSDKIHYGMCKILVK